MRPQQAITMPYTWHTISEGVVLLARHLSIDHEMSVRQVNLRTGLSDREVRACLEEDQTT